MENPARPYYLAMKVNSNNYIFLPLRSNIPHRYGFKLPSIKPNKPNCYTGLDYSKSIIVPRNQLNNYVNKKVSIPLKQVKVINNNINTIKAEYLKYFNYISKISKKQNPHI